MRAGAMAEARWPALWRQRCWQRGVAGTSGNVNIGGERDQHHHSRDELPGIAALSQAAGRCRRNHVTVDALKRLGRHAERPAT